MRYRVGLLTEIRRYGILKFIGGSLLYAGAFLLLYSPIVIYFWRI